MTVKAGLGGSVAIMLLAASLTLPGYATADSASVSVTFRVNPAITAQVVDGGLLVRSNAPWTLTAQGGTPDGAPISVNVSAPKTGSDGIFVPIEGLNDYTLVLDSR